MIFMLFSEQHSIWHIRHISQHPARPLFRASRIFDPLYIKMGIQVGDTSRNDICQYSSITELSNPSDELLQE